MIGFNSRVFIFAGIVSAGSVSFAEVKHNNIVFKDGDEIHIKNILTGDTEVVGRESLAKIIAILNKVSISDNEDLSKPTGKVCIWRLSIYRKNEQSERILIATLPLNTFVRSEIDSKIFAELPEMISMVAKMNSFLEKSE